MSKLVNAANAYLQEDGVKLPLILQVSRYVFKTLSAFGVYDIGDWPTLGSQNSVEDAITPVMDALRDFRDQVKR